MRRCTRCTTPESYPGVTFDEDGVCSLCSAATTKARTGGLGLEALGERVRSFGRGGPYDCVIPLSGGKDSTYILYSAVHDLGLVPIAVNYDSGSQSEEGRANVANACDALGVRLVVVRPDPHIQRKMLREILEISRELGCYTRTCTSCELMLRNSTVRVAREYNVPVVLWGSASAESVEEEEYEDYRYGRSARAVLASRFQTLRRLKLTPAKVARLLPHILRYTVLSVRQRVQMKVPLSCVLNPYGFMPFPASDPTIIHYFDYTSWEPGENTSLLEEKLGWRHPPGRDSRFDCLLYAFVEHRQLRLTGISDSGAIDCSFVREGKMTKEEALKRERATRERVVDECQALVDDLGVKRLPIDLPS